MSKAYISMFLASKVCPMLKYSDIYDPCEPLTIVIFNKSLRTFAYILPVGQCTRYTNQNSKSDRQFLSNILYVNFLCSSIN